MSITFFPAHAEEPLEWEDIKSLWASFAIGHLAKDVIFNFTPLSSRESVDDLFLPVKALLELRKIGGRLPLSPYEDIFPAVKQLKVEGYILEQNEVISIYRQLRMASDLHAVAGSWEENLNTIKRDILSIPCPKRVIEDFESIFDENFEVRSDASVELTRLHRSLNYAQQRLNGAFGKVVKQYRDQNILADTEETVRSGRRVLSVKSEHKRKIQGIIHDESGGGRISYIEPQSILDINNDIFDLRQDIKREIFRLIRDLCVQLRSIRHELKVIQEAIVKWDIIRARARFGEALDGICPVVRSTPRIKIIGGRHPLLKWQEKNGEGEVVPFDLTLENENRFLLVSGPNAGGKTVLMKAVGLLQLLVQSGLPVPVDADSEFGIFDQIFVDIGDQQSIEDDLSTYSSHLQNMKLFLENTNGESLILIDELGSGTDPRLGGAIAEAILHKLLKLGAFGVVTTHYSNLKSYAYRQKGVLNGAMMFDKEKLSPTYELRIGKPGSSFAFELAQKSRLPTDILAQAKKNAGQALVDVDQILADIQEERKEMEEKMRQLKIKEAQADQLRLTYEKMQKDIEGQRKRLKMVQKEYDISKGVQLDKKLNELLEKLKKERSLEKTRKKAKKVKEELAAHVKGLQKMEEKEWKERQKRSETRLKEGDHVKLRDSGTTGVIERIEKGKATVQTGVFRMEVKLRELRPIQEPMDVRKEKSVKLQSDSGVQSIKKKLDIRGMPKVEASKILDKYFDQVLVQNVHQVEVVHGMGSGVLRQLVKEKVKEFGVFSKMEHPQRELGGEGVTIITV
ncbi:MAG: endonuclease MutS2 [Bacteroidetes bacterium]|jgi:DNA mismatch repair protein MutS2|nr:endonuclease MutS2 [Bacteroidota bacterium]